MTAPAGDGIGGLCDRLEEARKAATEGPWQVDSDGEDLAVTAGTARGLPGSWMATDRIFTSDTGEWSGETEDESEQRRADAALIVAAVNALPALIAAARERDRLRAAVEGLAEELQGTAEITGGKVNGYAFADRLRAIAEEAS